MVIARDQLKIPQNLPLADPEFHKPGEINMLIGAGPALSLFSIGQIKLANANADCYMQKTRLGWIIGGGLEKLTDPMSINCNFIELEELVQKFWNIEEIEKERVYSSEESACIEHFNTTYSRNRDGRFVVSLPFKRDPPRLGNSYSSALRQLLSLKKKFSRNPSLETQYSAVINESIELGHMSVIKDSPEHDGFYMPHHAVIKESSSTTKIRVVFNASAKSSSGVSLNDTLMIGPTIQDSIFSLHLKFRLHEIAITADIEKMYKQVLVRPEDRKYQRSLWLDGDQVITLESNTVTFGISSAPFLAIQTIHKLAQHEKDRFPIGAKILINDVYVDDVISGASTVKEAIEIREQCTALLKRGGFNIRQWASNSPAVLIGLEEDQINSKLDLNKDGTLKTLGVEWNAKRDVYVYSAKCIDVQTRFSKRTILSEIAKIYDPLGLLGPITLHAKLIMQKLWQAKLDWDESVPVDLSTIWVKFCRQLALINNLTFDRRILDVEAESYELHGFCDASEAGYGACIYIRSISSKNITSKLYCAKSRVAPLKTVTLPRLELNGARLLTELYAEVKSSININIHRVYFWTDSTIVIHWIRAPASSLKSFVSNRVAAIQKISTPDQWFHVRSSDNPADALSRGQLPKEFTKNELWTEGPKWLKQNQSTWPRDVIKPLEILPEQKKHTVLTVSLADDSIFKNFSSYDQLLRTCSLCYRLLKNNKYKSKPAKAVSSDELMETEMRIIKMVQSNYYSKEIKILKTQKNLQKCRISQLDPFLDENGILRVGGRLQKANLRYDQRHPILLPSYNPVTDLIIKHQHVVNHHSGIQTTLFAVRQRFWLLDGKNQIRKIIRKCITCFRADPPNVQYKMGNLPKIRTERVRPFENTGVDCCGPFFIKEKKFRNTKQIKVWVVLFICMSTKAVHLEVLTDMSTEGFLAGLKRFTGRRGYPVSMSSDNGTNFRGANKELKELNQAMQSENEANQIMQYFTSKNMKWHFIPPLAPNFGGLWESHVKIFKHHFKRVTKNLLLTYDQFNTLVIEIEAIINSRPITPISNDPNDLQALTPGHFLIGDCLTSLPEPDYTPIPRNRLSVWQLLTKIKQDFWSRWQQEYLNELNVRHKWTTGDHKIKLGTLVIIKEKGLPSMQWKLGRVIKIHPGDDNIIRTVTLKTECGELTRSVTSLAPLPIEQDDQENLSN